MTKTQINAIRLYQLIPLNTMQHFANQMNISTMQLCDKVADTNGDWVNRLFNNESSYSLNDINHDFVGLIADDIDREEYNTYCISSYDGEDAHMQHRDRMYSFEELVLEITTSYKTNKL